MTITTGTVSKRAFIEKLTALNGKLAKYGFPGIELISFTNREVELTVSYNGHEVNETFMVADVVLTDPVVSFFGKTAKYLGAVHFTDGIPVIIAGDETFKAVEARMDSLTCDHCKVNRKRNKYFLFEENGKTVSIGSTCAKEYFGIDVELYLTTVAKALKDCEFAPESGDSFNRNPYGILSNVILATAEATDDFRKGWIPSSGDEATVREVSYRAGERLTPRPEFVKAVREKLIATYAAIEPETAFDFNVKHALFDADGNLVGGGKLGIVAYAIWAAYNPKTEKAPEPESNFVGSVGDKLDLTLTVKGNRMIESVYGRSYLLTLVDASGNLFKTFTTGAIAGAGIGETLTVKATVKDHELDRYNDEKKTTVLTRMKEV